jgi:hypothetical protein
MPHFWYLLCSWSVTDILAVPRPVISIMSRVPIPLLRYQLIHFTFLSDVPAAIVSPPLRIKTRPISLLFAAVSRGIVADRVLPGNALKVNSTEAVTPFCNTLICQLVHHADVSGMKLTWVSVAHCLPSR